MGKDKLLRIRLQETRQFEMGNVLESSGLSRAGLIRAHPIGEDCAYHLQCALVRHQVNLLGWITHDKTARVWHSDVLVLFLFLVLDRWMRDRGTPPDRVRRCRVPRTEFKH